MKFKRKFELIKISPGSALFQYVDELMIGVPAQIQCGKDQVAVLKRLVEEGHKASLSNEGHFWVM